MFAYSVAAAASIQSHYQPPINNISIPSIPKPKPLPIFLPPITNPKLPPSSSTLKSQFQKGKNPRKPRKIVVAAENGNNEPITDPKEQEEIEKNEDDDGIDNKNKKMNAGDEEERKRRNGRPAFNLRWGDLLLDPDPDNILAVGLTGLLAWASVQVLWQLFFISVAIIVAALKYHVAMAAVKGAAKGNEKVQLRLHELVSGLEGDIKKTVEYIVKEKTDPAYLNDVGNLKVDTSSLSEG